MRVLDRATGLEMRASHSRQDHPTHSHAASAPTQTPQQAPRLLWCLSTKENADRPADEQMRFRIGIHVGDIMVQGNNLPLPDKPSIAVLLVYARLSWRCAGAFDELRRVVRTRQPEGYAQPLAYHPHSGRHVAEMSADLDAARLITYRAAWPSDTQGSGAAGVTAHLLWSARGTESLQTCMEGAGFEPPVPLTPETLFRIPYFAAANHTPSEGRSSRSGGGRRFEPPSRSRAGRKAVVQPSSRGPTRAPAQGVPP
jgi:acyl-CoA dehydrogenase-like protein